MATGNLRTCGLANGYSADHACGPGPQNTHVLVLGMHDKQKKWSLVNWWDKDKIFHFEIFKNIMEILKYFEIFQDHFFEIFHDFFLIFIIKWLKTFKNMINMINVYKVTR